MIIADLSMTGVAHLYFNSAFIRMMNDVVESDVRIFAEEKHARLLKSRLIGINAIYSTFRMKSRSGIGVCLQDFWGCLLIIKIMFIAKKEETLVLLNRLPFTLLVSNVINLFLKRSIFNILHGELEYLVNDKISGLTRYYYKIFKFAYKMSTFNNTYIFLGQSIKEKTLSSRVRFGNAKIIVIDHPYDYDNKNNCYANFNFDKIKIGIIGTASIRKNSQYLLSLYKKVHNPSVNLCVIGKAEKELKSLLNQTDISFFSDNISTDIYEGLLRELNYSLCFYDNNVNLALASGSFFDSIKFAKPILGLKGNPYVEYYFKKLGNIGYLFDSLENMANFINSISLNEIDKYRDQVSNLISAQNTLSLNTIKNEFKSQITIKII